MKKTTFLSLIVLFLSFQGFSADKDYTINFVQGTVEMKSVSSLSFGPAGILFVGDPIAATVYAIDTKDQQAPANKEGVSVKNIDQKLASMLGIGVDALQIHDMAVNPVSENIYLSISRGETPLLMRIKKDGSIEEVNLANVSYSKLDLLKPVSADAKRRGRSLRTLAITDLAFAEDHLYVAGLSNEEFSSTFRTVPFPFEENQQLTSLEIYHAAHGKYETQSPIQTFMPMMLEGEAHILASYTCTPLVTFPVSQLQKGGKVMGKTVAELGNRNAPLDIISFTQKDKDYVLIANSNRTLMKIDPADIASHSESLNKRVERHGTEGVPFLGLAEIGVQQLDNLNGQFIVMIQRDGRGNLNVRSVSKNRL